MIKTSNALQLIDAVETMILTTDDHEVLSAPAERVSAAALEVRGIVSRSLSGRADRADVVQPRKSGRSSRGPGPLMDYLKRLVTARPEVSPNLAAAFAAGKSPSQEEVEALAVELLKARMSSPGPVRKRRTAGPRG